MAEQHPRTGEPDESEQHPAPSSPASGPPASGPPASGPPASVPPGGSGTPVWPDPYPSGPYASVWFPSGPYAPGAGGGAGSAADTRPVSGPGSAGSAAPTVPLRPPAGGTPGTLPLPASGPAFPGGDPGAIIAEIGDIRVSSSTIFTPVGQFPLRGSQWTVNDQWVATQRTPTWAILCAIFGFFCLTVFSLLFLLAKQTVYSGVVHVTVTSGRFQYDTRIPVTDQPQVQRLHDLVNYVRSVSVA